MSLEQAAQAGATVHCRPSVQPACPALQSPAAQLAVDASQASFHIRSGSLDVSAD
eukprot:SAG22_NODE_2132_length_2962_cov_1.578414_5_plen_54_part_01